MFGNYYNDRYNNRNNDRNYNYESYTQPNYYGEYNLDYPDDEEYPEESQRRSNDSYLSNKTLSTKTVDKILKKRHTKRLELMQAIAEGSGSLSAFKYGIEGLDLDPDGAYAEDKKKDSFLVTAIKSKNYEIIDYLMNIPAQRKVPTFSFPTETAATASKTYIVYDEQEPTVLGIDAGLPLATLKILMSKMKSMNHYVKTKDNNGKPLFIPLLLYIIKKVTNRYTSHSYNVDGISRILKEFIAAGADPTIKDSDGLTILDYYTIIDDFYMDMFENKHIRPSKMSTVVNAINAAAQGQHQISEFSFYMRLMDAYPDYDFKFSNILSTYGSRYLYYLNWINDGFLSFVKYLLAKGANPFKTFNGISFYARAATIYSVYGVGSLHPKVNQLIHILLENAYNKLEGTPEERANIVAKKYVIGYLLTYKTRDLELKKAIESLPESHPMSAPLKAIVAEYTAPKKWQGFPKQVVTELYKVLSNPDDLKNISACPVCLESLPREGGCLYMHHNCSIAVTKITHPFGAYNKELYTKYMGASGDIWWCVSCNRICSGHTHYNLHRHNERPSLYVATEAVPQIAMFGDSCKNSLIGGGGVEEKLVRFEKLLDAAKSAEALRDSATLEDVISQITNAFFDAPRIVEDVDIVATNISSRGSFTVRPEDFQIVEFKPEPNNFNLPNIHRQSADTYRPVVIKKTMTNAISLDDVNPAYRFRHFANGYVFTHSEDQVLGKETIINWANKPITDADFGLCPFYNSDPPCKALLYPDELEGIVPDDIQDAYRIKFNRKFHHLLRGARGGGVRGGAQQRRFRKTMRKKRTAQRKSRRAGRR